MEKGFNKYEPAELIDFGKKTGFEKMDVRDIVNGKSFMVIYTK